MDDKRRERILMLTLALVIVSLGTLAAVYFYISELLAVVVGVFLLAVVIILTIEANERNQVRGLLGMLLEYEATKNKVEYIRQQQHLQVLKDKQRAERGNAELKLIEQEEKTSFDPRLLKVPETDESWYPVEDENFRIVDV